LDIALALTKLDFLESRLWRSRNAIQFQKKKLPSGGSAGRLSSIRDRQRSEDIWIVLARLGEFLYWGGCVLAVLIALLGGFMVWDSDAAEAPEYIVLTVVVGGLIWSIGRGARYVLAGR
jgi:hypothetical protein